MGGGGISPAFTPGAPTCQRSHAFLESSSRWLGILLLLAAMASCLVARAATQGDFDYVDYGASVTITRYHGLGGAVAIPDAIAGGIFVEPDGDADEREGGEQPERAAYIGGTIIIGAVALSILGGRWMTRGTT